MGGSLEAAVEERCGRVDCAIINPDYHSGILEEEGMEVQED